MLMSSWISIVTTALTAGYTYECVIWALDARSLAQARYVRLLQELMLLKLSP
jgi:hypothetical protein